MPRASDQHAALGADDLLGLVEHDLDRARVALVSGGGGLRRKLLGTLAGLDIAQRDDCALGLGNGLVRDHEQLPVAQSLTFFAGCGDDQAGEVVTGVQLGQAGNGTGAQAGHCSGSLNWR